MALTLLQQYEVLHEVRRLHAEMNNVVSQLDRVAELRARYGDNVVTFLAGVISPAEWQDTRNWVVSRRDLLRQRVQAEMGDGLDALADSET